MNIQQMKAKVVSATDLSPSAREITLALPSPLGFAPGAFVNLFVETGGKRVRRAYSISSNANKQDEITLSIRRNETAGSLSPVFWEKGVEDLTVSIMGPLGLNTAEKIEHSKVYLFGFGIGVSVVKSLAEHLLGRPEIEEVIVVTGSRTEDEILYKDFFEKLRGKDNRLTLRFVVSRPTTAEYPYEGYVQEFIGDFDFNDSTTYLCGQGKACLALRDAIEAKRPERLQVLIESFDS